MHTWKFWIDVGGTFTDCVARDPDGQLHREKVLSSGVVPGRAGVGSTESAVCDPQRMGEPDQLWCGARIRLWEAPGGTAATSTVARFDGARGVLELATAFPAPPVPGQAYELDMGQEAPLVAVRRVLRLAADESLPPLELRLGTTRGTNALLTRRGARTALVTTRGFADVLHIGYQNRPRLFDLTICKPEPLFVAVAEIDERVTADGKILQTLDTDQVRAALAELQSAGIESLAVCLLHAYQVPEHERQVALVARELGFRHISVSSEVAPLIKIVARGDTTVVDAYLNPVLTDYVQRIRSALGGPTSDVRLLTSAGGLVAADRFRGKDSILSGPAGGVVGFSKIAQAAGFDRAIGLDMGGTSTDVSRFDGRYEFQYETEKAGVRVVAPMLAIETVAAGGGSICRCDGIKLVVGPDSAGAEPGPACYGRGGPLTVTDANLLLGRLAPERFPFPLDTRAAQSRLNELVDEVDRATGIRYAACDLAAGLVAVANANMVRAMRAISVAKGYDPRDYVLVAFGGAAPQHACALAEELGMSTILVPPDAGLLSALGIGLADALRHGVAGVYRPFSDTLLAQLAQTWEDLAQTAQSELEAEGISARQTTVRRQLEMRYAGTDAALLVEHPVAANWQAAFEAEHQRRYGYVHADRALEVVAARVEVSAPAEMIWPRSARRAVRRRTAADVQQCFFHGRTRESGVFVRESLEPGDTCDGPAIIVDQAATTVVYPGWQAETLDSGELLLTRSALSGEPPSASAHPGDTNERTDPIQLEIFNNQFAAIAEQMGVTLRNTASSVNVKERLDFSCALFTGRGDLVVNAPHIPVHLGAMGETVRAVLEDNPEIAPGDVYLTNDPFRGGSHLPDITVITPIHAGPDASRPAFFTASRAHHAEIGGIAPGSMPPFSRSLAEEGVVLRNLKLVDAGRPRFDVLEDLLSQAAYPSRNVQDNLADVAAQLAANRQGATQLIELVERRGFDTVVRAMNDIQEAAARKCRHALERIPAGAHVFVDHLDDGTPIVVAVRRTATRTEIDFTGTGPVMPGNLNANPAIVSAAVLYVLRCLIDEDIPLNSGVLQPVDLVLPEGLLNPPVHTDPARSAAVAGGNVETSQRVVDALLGALGVAAASQGTMNNVLFGDGSFGYYETICGGAGATPFGPGADAVHTHMTNTRMTDPEVLEKRFPVRVLSLAIRRGSGGRGRHRGGDGVVRRLEFLRSLELSILSQRRGPYAPYGLAGGQPGALGINRILRADGRQEILPALAYTRVAPGDVLHIETPGGGGYNTSAFPG